MNINKESTNKIMLYPSQAKTIYRKNHTKIVDFVITKNQKKVYVLYYSGTILGFKLSTLKEIGQINVKLNDVSQIQEHQNQIAVGGYNSSTLLIYNFKINCVLYELRHFGNRIKSFCFHDKSASSISETNDQLFYSLDFENQLYIWTLQTGIMLTKIKLNQGLTTFTIPQNLSTKTIIKIFQKAQHKININMFKQFQSIHLTNYKGENEKYKLYLSKNLVIQVNSYAYADKATLFSIYQNKIIRQNKSLKGIDEAIFINDFKWLIITLKNTNVIIYDTSTFKFVTSIINCYQFQKIKLSKRNNYIVIMAFNEFGLKIWNQQ